MTLLGSRRTATSGQAVPTDRRRARRTIYLVSTAGHPNYGDELVVRRWLRLLARTEPDSDVWLDCPNPGSASVLFADAHPRLRTTDTLFRLCWEAPSDEARDVAKFVQRALADPGAAPRWVRGIELLRTVDVLHLLGGGYLNGLWPRQLGIVAGAVWLGRERGVRCVGTGLGLFPIDDAGGEIWREAAAEFAVLTVGDEASAELLRDRPQVDLRPDDALLGGVAGVFDTRAQGSPEVMVCVQSDLLEQDLPVVRDTVVRFLESVDAGRRTVGFVECIPRVDRVVYDAVRDVVPDARFYPVWELLDHGLPARPGQVWLSSRYHPHLLAAAAGASGVALSVNADYYGTKHRAARRMGSEWPVIAPGDDIPVAGPPGELASRVPEHSARLLETARSIYRR